MNRMIARNFQMVLILSVMFLPFWRAAPLFAQSSQQAGNVLFKLPNGWQRLDKSGAVLLLPGDTTQGDCVIVIAPGQELQGNFRTWFDRIVGQLVADNKIIEKTDDQERKNEAGYSVLYKAVVTEDAQGQRFIHLFYGMNPGNRVELFALLVKNEQLLTKYEQPFLDFVGSVQFANLGATASGPNAGGGKAAAKSSASAVGVRGVVGKWYRTAYYHNRNTKYTDGGAIVSSGSSSAGYL